MATGVGVKIWQAHRYRNFDHAYGSQQTVRECEGARMGVGVGEWVRV